MKTAARSPFASITVKLATLCVFGISCVALGDEGMWTFHNPPVKKLKDEYGFDLTQEWLDHVRLSSVRFNSGGSGSFISGNGLVLTNHHVASESIHKLSSDVSDFLDNGFHAKTQADELKCPDLELNVLVSMADVTEQVKSAVKDGMTPEQSAAARRAATSRIENDARKQNGLRSNVVALYRGGEYWLYQYKQYTDVRLAFAPEVAVGYFGGDPDNFTYPRYNLDFALFRVYEDGKPAATPNFLKWNSNGLKEGDLVFTSGHPGSTERLRTYAQVEYLRDVGRPRSLAILTRLSDALNEFGRTSEEARRQAAEALFGIENSRKAYTGELVGLRDPELMTHKKQSEQELRTTIQANEKLSKSVGDAFEVIEKVQRDNAMSDQQRAFRRMQGALAGHALSIVRLVNEITKPNGERLPQYRDSSLDSTRLDLFSTAPIYPGLEETMLRTGFELAAENLGSDDGFVQAALGGDSPAAVAKRIVAGTKLMDPEFRKALVDGGKAAVDKCEDPLIVLARKVDPMLRELIKKQDEASAVTSDAAGKIAQARFQIYGNTVYPDATFTLRLAYGTVRGYSEDTTLVPWKTTFYGLFERFHAFDGKPPFHLPKSVLAHEKDLDLSTPLDFVHTCDITGGNSGSPTLNRAGEIVGLVFDGNVQSLANDLVYANGADRSLSVHCGGIIEALEKIYGAHELVVEIQGGAKKKDG